MPEKRLASSAMGKRKRHRRAPHTTSHTRPRQPVVTSGDASSALGADGMISYRDELGDAYDRTLRDCAAVTGQAWSHVCEH